MKLYSFLRPVHILLAIVFGFMIVDGMLALYGYQCRKWDNERIAKLRIATKSFGLSDLCISTEARYTRHPAVSDSLAPFMDHPGAIEHFPSGSFWAPPRIVHSK